MLPDIQPGNTKILYFFNCLLDGMHTILFPDGIYFACGKLQFTIIHCSWEWNRISDIRDSCQIHDASLESKSES